MTEPDLTREKHATEGLDAPAQLAEHLCADLTTEMGTLQPCRDGVEDDRLPVRWAEGCSRASQLKCPPGRVTSP